MYIPPVWRSDFENAPKGMDEKVDIWVRGPERSFRAADCYYSPSTGAWISSGDGRYVTGRDLIDEDGERAYDPTDKSKNAWVAVCWMVVPPPDNG